MKTDNATMKIIGAWVMIGVMTAAAFGQTFDDPLGYAVIVQQSPAAGGVVMPGSGVMKVAPGEKVTLTAKPNPGYHFVYWLGDVSSATAAQTSIQVDSPKLVIAVFERDTFDDPLELAQGAGGGGGGGGLYRSPDPITGAGATTAGTGPGRMKYTPLVIPPDDNEPDEGDFPVPGDDDNTIPEPATALLLGLGALGLAKMRKS